MHNYSAIVLAAGLSSRMAGRNKLLLPLGHDTVVRHAVLNAIAGEFQSVIVVTGHDAEFVHDALSGLPVTFCHNSNFLNGMASSLLCGLSAVAEDASGSFVLLGDMPLIQPATMMILSAAGAKNPEAAAVVPVYRDAWAHPVLLHRMIFPLLQSLRGDQGARRVLMQRRDVTLVPVADEGCILDADTPDGYAAIRAKYAQKYG